MKRRWILLLLLTVLLGMGWKSYTEEYVWVAGVSVPRTAESVDLRGKSISVRRFQRVQEALPDCDIFWDVPLQGERYSSDTEALTVTKLTAKDAAALECFPNLIRLDASQCSDYDILLDFSRAHPDCQVVYQVPIGTQRFHQDTECPVFREDVTGELLEKLRYLPRVQQVDFADVLPDAESLRQLQQTYPEVHFRWVRSCGERTLSSDDAVLDLSHMELTAPELEELLVWFPMAETIQLTGCSLTDEALMAMADAHEERFFLWNMTIGEYSVSTDAEEVDISGYKMESTEEIEALLPYFPNVKKVVMSKCGLDDETMDALNRRYEDIRFVWSIKIKRFYVRTDADHFYPFKFTAQRTFTSEDLHPLRYCTDMVAIDVGHMQGVKDCEWAAFMPNLTYLILADTSVKDITPLSGLKNLVFLELFESKVKDLSPLVSCTSLVDLNVGRLKADWRPLTQMPWLEHLWWNGIRYWEDVPCEGAEDELPKYLPNTVMQFNRGAMVQENGWRQLTHYKDMRDVMDMFYLE